MIGFSTALRPRRRDDSELSGWIHGGIISSDVKPGCDYHARSNADVFSSSKGYAGGRVGLLPCFIKEVTKMSKGDGAWMHVSLARPEMEHLPTSGRDFSLGEVSMMSEKVCAYHVWKKLQGNPRAGRLEEKVRRHTTPQVNVECYREHTHMAGIHSTIRGLSGHQTLTSSVFRHQRVTTPELSSIFFWWEAFNG
ncbi:hypothetical protein B0H34DRAFT_732652 [Crassisporium funariophilum]|nr:hypothetical protein B0H34DRAFT_732652 [Crassisporium funariophilum]